MTDRFEQMARDAARALPPSDFGSTRAIQAVAALLRQIAEETRQRCVEAVGAYAAPSCNCDACDASRTIADHIIALDLTKEGPKP